VVGLDADRTGGAGRQDPLLPDRARQAIAPGRLATSAERREEGAFRLAAALAGLRGRVTLSHATSATLDGREAGPSPLLLQAWRLVRGDASLSYEQLRDELRPPASAVPARGADGALAGVVPTFAESTRSEGNGRGACLDARDVWLDALADGPLLLDGGDVVRAAFPMLDAGLRAQELAAGDELTAHHGLVPEAGATLDPSARPDREISPSALEKLASCPLAWFYRYGLSLRPPQDPAYDAERWLDALDRGSLLHEVFEAFTKEYATDQAAILAPAARARVLAIADEAIVRWREKVPPPGEAVFELEAAEIRRAALAFLQMEREHLAGSDGARWSLFELDLGAGERRGVFPLPDGGTLAVRGRADRVDELPDGTLRVVDYKTGRGTRYAKVPKGGAFNGGRQLQPAIYAAAVEAICGRTVSRFEYRFPTERGGNETVVYTAEELAPARDVVGSLLAHVRAGEFVPTTSGDDCKFCDFGTICRASHGDFRTDSPRADWAAERAPGLPIYEPMLARRGGRPSGETPA
jgi:ATP-dependent helicase/nuclease subunit B